MVEEALCERERAALRAVVAARQAASRASPPAKLDKLVLARGGSLAWAASSADGALGPPSGGVAPTIITSWASCKTASDDVTSARPELKVSFALHNHHVLLRDPSRYGRNQTTAEPCKQEGEGSAFSKERGRQEAVWGDGHPVAYPE